MNARVLPISSAGKTELLDSTEGQKHSKKASANGVERRRDLIFAKQSGRDMMMFLANRCVEASEGFTPEDTAGLGEILRLMANHDE
jgi:hypothetical protein